MVREFLYLLTPFTIGVESSSSGETTSRSRYTSVRRDFILPVNKERREMVGNIILYFSTLSSAYRLKVPLPPYLPPAEKARQNLVRRT